MIFGWILHIFGPKSWFSTDLTHIWPKIMIFNGFDTYLDQNCGLIPYRIHVVYAFGGLIHIRIHVVYAFGRLIPYRIHVVYAFGGLIPYRIHVVYAFGGLIPYRIHVVYAFGGLIPYLKKNSSSIEYMLYLVYLRTPARTTMQRLTFRRDKPTEGG